MSKKQYTHIYFDLDRTLWDFVGNSSEVLRDILDRFSLREQINNEEEFIVKYNDYNDRLWDKYREGRIRKHILRQERFRMLLKDYGIKDMDLIDKINRYYLNTTPARSQLIENAAEILAYLSSRYKLYILSNGFYDVQLTKMKSSGISKYFTKTFTSDRIGYAKPHARIFEYAINSENAKKDECLMVGDDPKNDVEGARNANIDQVYFNPEKEKSDVKATYTISELMELKKIL